MRLLLAEGDALSELDLNERWRDAYARAIELAPPGSTAMLEGHYGLLSCYGNLPQLRDCQLDAGLKALQTFPFDAQAFAGDGQLSARQGPAGLSQPARSRSR